ncbi:unnamed protein product [Owenia fusiformis]|uniref:Uncharacterized protein n=1 Tax=Owenia fusiformis TaxID=6347 RepID=A0A8J1XII4_OWEFU|nr:unnamed protein product [Owenia fusiformis]
MGKNCLQLCILIAILNVGIFPSSVYTFQNVGKLFDDIWDKKDDTIKNIANGIKKTMKSVDKIKEFNQIQKDVMESIDDVKDAFKIDAIAKKIQNNKNDGEAFKHGKKGLKSTIKKTHEFLEEMVNEVDLQEIWKQFNYAGQAIFGTNTNAESNDALDPEVHMNASELILSKGYPCEEYTVQTDDGFLLGVQRIPHGRKTRDQYSRSEEEMSQHHSRPVVLLQHGLLCSSTNWIANLANESLGFLLADAGYDVWLGNSRGNTYSRKHVKYTPDQAEFWAWSWDQMGELDLPATIDFILDHTGQKQLHYVGHSQGTMIAFAQFSSNQTTAQKVKSFTALAPVAYLSNMKSVLRYFSYIYPEIKELFYLLGVKDFLPSNELMHFLASKVCTRETEIFCSSFLFIICGFDSQQLNMTRLPVYLSHTPAGTSVQNMVHYAQMVRSGLFQKYDYMSVKENQKHYHQDSPPVYDASKLNVPTYIWYSNNDWLADPQDVQILLDDIHQTVRYVRELEKWNHLDFIWGMDAPQEVYYDIIKFLDNEEGMSYINGPF